MQQAHQRDDAPAGGHVDNGGVMHQQQQQQAHQRDDAPAGGHVDRRDHQEESRCHKFCQHPNPMRVRYVYATLFLVANVFAWVTRESRVTFFQGQRLNGCHGDRECLAADAVLIISFASFWWLPKTFLLGASIIISTFTPTHWIQLYVGITLMAIWYTASRLNATFIGTTVLLAYLMPLISLKHELRSIVVSEDDVPYGYGFFHFIFATGSMYFGMLFVGWDTHRPLENGDTGCSGICDRMAPAAACEHLWNR
nr:unnamed protein product [Digitaria exilis]